MTLAAVVVATSAIVVVVVVKVVGMPIVMLPTPTVPKNNNWHATACSGMLQAVGGKG